MPKELKQLFESELLNDETKKEITEAVDQIKEEAVTEAKKELEVEYAKKLSEQKEQLSKKMYDLINEAVEEEISELKEDIKYSKEIEPKYAKKLEEFKTEYKKTLSENFNGLVEECVKDEIKELEDDLMEAKNNHFGLQIFEAFKNTFEKIGVTEDVSAIKDKVDELNGKLEESQNKVAELEREKVMEGLLKNLSGSKREVMQTILESVETSKLEGRYNETIDSVLKESSEEDIKNEDNKVINESEDDQTVVKDMDYDYLRKLIN